MSEKYISEVWYVKSNDLSWCIMPIDEPPSSGTIEVADLISKELAEHIVFIHNIWLSERKVSG